MVSSKFIFIFVVTCFGISRINCAPIVNGNAKPMEPGFGDYPFHASLMQLIGREKYHSFCGGSLIHPRWILTAAHCIQEDRYSRPFKPGEIYVALGSIYRSGKKAQILRVRRTVIHPTYLRTDRNDIGLLQLKTSAKLGNKVSTKKLLVSDVLGPNVKLIRLHTNNNESLLKKKAYLTGFGVINDNRRSPRRLRKAIFHITSYQKCTGESRYKNVEICAASTLREGKACDGDSGGPLFTIKNKKRVQIGITSYLARSARCEQVNNNSVYTRVSVYIPWMSRVTGINFMEYNKK